MGGSSGLPGGTVDTASRYIESIYRRNHPGPLGALALLGTLAVMGGQVDYSLRRRAILREYQSGQKSRIDVCDAHPELMRAARYVGAETARECPICEDGHLRLVSYIYGDGLRRHRANGRCITRSGELEELGELVDEFTCYEVEVCTDCSWNHLARSYLLGRRHAG